MASSSSSEPSSPKPKVEKFLSACWLNLMTRDDQLKETVRGRATAPRKRETKRSTGNKNDDERRESSEQAHKRGRPISNLHWLPPGWERITKSRASGQKDTFYREIETKRTMRSAYEVTSYMEFGRVIKRDKERVKPILEAKYSIKFPKEKRKKVALMESSKDSVLALPGPLGSVEETSAKAEDDQK